MCECNIPGILCAIAHGGDVNHVYEEKGSMTAILLAVEMVSLVEH